MHRIVYFLRDMTFHVFLHVNGIIINKKYTVWRCHAHKKNEKKTSLVGFAELDKDGAFQVRVRIPTSRVRVRVPTFRERVRIPIL